MADIPAIAMLPEGNSGANQSCWRLANGGSESYSYQGETPASTLLFQHGWVYRYKYSLNAMRCNVMICFVM